MIVITGANGKLGRLIVESVLARIPASEVGVSTRDPENASGLQARGVRVRFGDFAQPDTLLHAFEGATRLLVVSSNAAALGGDPLAQHRAVIEAAKQVRPRRIFYTSHMGAGAESAFPPMLTHAATETMLAESGLKWTALRNGFYAESALRFMGEDWRQGGIHAPADGKVAWTSHADLARAAAAILIGVAVYNGPTPPLTGRQALDLQDLALLGSEITQRPIERHIVDGAAYREQLKLHGLPEHVAGIMLGFYEAAHRGEFSQTDPTLETLIGREPETMRQVLSSSKTLP